MKDEKQKEQELLIILVGNSVQIILPNGKVYFKNLKNFAGKISKALSLLQDQEEQRKEGNSPKVYPIKTVALLSA